MLEGFEMTMQSGNFDKNDPELMKKFFDLQENLLSN